MKALSVLQPWASLLPSGEKEYETRSWPAPPSMIGLTIAIHASKAFNAEERELALQPEFREAMKRGGFKKLGDLPRGAIIGTATLVACERTEAIRDALSPKELAFGNYDDERFAWKLANAQRIEPVLCKGALGLWTVPVAVHAQFRYVGSPFTVNGVDVSAAACLAAAPESFLTPHTPGRAIELEGYFDAGTWVRCMAPFCQCGGQHPVNAIRATETHMLHESQFGPDGNSPTGFSITHRATGCSVVENIPLGVADELMTLFEAVPPPWKDITADDFDDKALWRKCTAFLEEMLGVAVAAQVKS